MAGEIALIIGSGTALYYMIKIIAGLLSAGPKW